MTLKADDQSSWFATDHSQAIAIILMAIAIVLLGMALWS